MDIKVRDSNGALLAEGRQRHADQGSEAEGFVDGAEARHRDQRHSPHRQRR